ncbi:uncharacterized protein LOC117104435 isoform X2 [Anneissia japonica]|nr:uncharacterized protein LOC117104435 isoform X2 [Anneissia japonica]
MAELQIRKLLKCSECMSTDCGLKLKCVHSLCLQCLQNMYNDNQTIKCIICDKGAKKQRISSEHSVLDASNVADHVLIQEKFVVKLTTKNHNSKAEYEKCLQVKCKLISVSGNEKEMSMENHRDGTYDFSGCCDVGGVMELRCYVNDLQIRQSPLKVNVVKGGLQEHPNIFKDKEDASLYMFDIVDDTVYACGGINEIAKLTLKGELIGTIYGHKSCQFTSLCCVNVEGDLSIVCYDEYMKRLLVYMKESWREWKGVKIESVFGKMIAHNHKIYVPDFGKHRVLCFSMKGELVNKIEGRNYKNVKLSKPYGVAMTKQENMLVLSYGDDQVVKIDEDDKAEVLIENTDYEKLLFYAYAIDIDEQGQIIIGCCRKLLLFNQDGKFIKNIDIEKNVPDCPYSICCRNRCIWVSDKSDSSLRLYYY